MAARFPNNSWETSTWPAVERLLPQVLAVTDRAERLAVANEAVGWLLNRASTYLPGRGQYRRAIPLAERAVTLTESALGPGDPEVAWRRDELGRVLKTMGDLQGSRAQCEQVPRISQAALGPQHPAVHRQSNPSGAHRRMIDVRAVQEDVGDSDCRLA